MNLHPNPTCQTIPGKALIPKSLGTRSRRINPWMPADEPAAKQYPLLPAMNYLRQLTARE